MNKFEKLKHSIKNFVACRMGKKGILGMDTAQKFIIGLLSLVIIGVMVLVVLGALVSTAVVSNTAGAADIINNTSAGLVALFSNAVTWFVLLGIVIIILIIGVVIVTVKAFDQGAKGGL